MINEMKIRLLGYYCKPNQILYPETERVQEANALAPLLEASIESLFQNPETDDDIKRVIQKPTVFVFKAEDAMENPL